MWRVGRLPMRFLSHMTIVSVLAPAAGGALYSFWEADWHDAMLLVRVFGSLLGGFVLLAFVWFWTIPLGLLTFAVCWGLRDAHVKNTAVWALGGAALGLLVGQLVPLWANVQPTLFLTSGLPFGFMTGLALKGVWMRDSTDRAPEVTDER